MRTSRLAALVAVLVPVLVRAAPGAPTAPGAPAAAEAALAVEAPLVEGADEPEGALPPGTRNGVLRNLQTPPPGAPEDVALWNRANENDLKLMAARGEATRLQGAAASSGYARRLDEAVARGALTAKKAAALKARVEEEWAEVVRVATARWRIDPTRVCRYPFIAFDNLMEMAESPTKAPRLAEARGRLLECTTIAESILKQLAAANASLREAMAAVDAAAGAAPAAAKAPAAAEQR